MSTIQNGFGLCSNKVSIQVSWAVRFSNRRTGDDVEEAHFAKASNPSGSNPFAQTVTGSVGNPVRNVRNVNVMASSEPPGSRVAKMWTSLIIIGPFKKCVLVWLEHFALEKWISLDTDSFGFGGSSHLIDHGRDVALATMPDGSKPTDATGKILRQRDRFN